MNAITVDAVICDENAKTAEIYGTATVNGAGSHEYRIRVKDGGQGSDPGDTYGIIVPGILYDSGDQPLGGGNISIRFK